MGGIIVGSMIYFLMNRSPYLLGGLGAFGVVYIFIFILPAGYINYNNVEIIRSIITYVFVMMVSILLIKTPIRKVVYSMTLIGVVFEASTNNVIILSVLIIIVVLWNLMQKRYVVNNIASCYEINKDIEHSGAFIFAGLISFCLYNIDEDVDYMVMLLLNLLVATLSLKNHLYNIKIVQETLNQVGYIEVEDIQENILSGKVENRGRYVRKILEKSVEHHKCICIEGKKEYFVLPNIREKIVQGIKERKSIEQIENMVKNMRMGEIPREVIVAVKTASNIDLGICYEPRMANFILMKYNFANHPLIGECEKVKCAYWEGFCYILDKYNRDILTSKIIKNNLDKALNLKDVNRKKTDDSAKIMKQIINAGNVFWHGGFKFGKRDIRFLFVLESMYIVAVSLGHIDYDTMRTYCELLKINKKEYQQIENFLEVIFQTDKRIDTIINNCKSHKLRLAMEYVGHITRTLMHFPSLPRYRVAVCATMSSGKSTFINALLGHDFIPSGNQACTAKVTTIEDNDRVGQKVLGSSMNLRGESFYDDNVSSEKIKEWNEQVDINSIYLETDLQNVSSEENVLVIYDTPGTNYSQDETHKAQTMDFLKSHEVDMILYLINAEHSSTDDNKSLLLELKENILIGRGTKIIFLINKFDSLEGDDINALVDDVRNELEDIGFGSPVILPVSSNAARLFQMALSEDEFTKRELIEFEDMFELFSIEKFDVTEYLDLNLQNIGKEEVERKQGIVNVGGKDYAREALMEATRRTGIMAVTAYVNREINKVERGRNVA